MPYRIDVSRAPADAFDRLVELGALDVDETSGGLAAIMPDGVDAAEVSRQLGVDVRVGPARGRDADSVWVVGPRPVLAGRLRILPATEPPRAGALRIIDGHAFGTGLHPTTVLCLEALEREIDTSMPASVLDVGTGSGILALAALAAGVPRAVGLDIDLEAVRAARANARLNDLASRLLLFQGGPEALIGAWPLIAANVLAAPLIEMAPALARLASRRGRLLLSGVRTSLADDVARACVRTGLQQVRADEREGWAALTFHASW